MTLVSACTAQTNKPVLEVASIKQTQTGARPGVRAMPGGHTTFTNETLKDLIQWAYNVQDYQISGGPKWVDTVHYDIDAKPERALTPSMDTLADFREMMQALLSERFHLEIQRSAKELPVYALVIGKGGTKLIDRGKPEKPTGMRMSGGAGRMTGQQIQVVLIAQSLGTVLGRPVENETGLNGYYDFTLEWTPEGTDGNGPSIFTALQEQLGLRLETRRGMVEMLTIGRTERPSEN
jgi:uncharacterized protein (TIGR03435 family)